MQSALKKISSFINIIYAVKTGRLWHDSYILSSKTGCFLVLHVKFMLAFHWFTRFVWQFYFPIQWKPSIV